MDKINDTCVNPLLCLDYPDPDVIRVEDTYYMVSTTMHFMPGCEILRSYDLINWEHAAYVYDRLDSTAAQTLTGEQNAYGKGMWAACIRYHKGTFYVCFVANDTGKTYLYTSTDINGVWDKKNIEGFYHDCSILFDDDDRVYIVSGNKNIYLVELKPDLSGPLEGGINRLIVSDEGNPSLGYEGTHFYKINGKYYLFFIHSLRDRWRRVEACFVADSIDGEFVGGDVLNDDMGYCGQGVAQGGIVDTPDGKWFGILFQDRGAVGRIPVIVPVSWENDYPVFGVDGEIPADINTVSTRPEYRYRPLVESDDFKNREKNVYGLKPCWQFNHEPDIDFVKLDTVNGCWQIENQKICENLTQARNTITQRMKSPFCEAQVTVDCTEINNGDYAGLCALQGCYSMIAVTKNSDKYYVSLLGKEIEEKQIEITSSKVRFRLEVDFMNMRDEATFYYSELTDAGEIKEWHRVGMAKLYFRLDHFTGCRFGLCSYATTDVGGKAKFFDFIYQ